MNYTIDVRVSKFTKKKSSTKRCSARFLRRSSLFGFGFRPNIRSAPQLMGTMPPLYCRCGPVLARNNIGRLYFHRNISEEKITNCTKLSDLTSFQDIEFRKKNNTWSNNLFLFGCNKINIGQTDSFRWKFGKLKKAKKAQQTDTHTNVLLCSRFICCLKIQRRHFVSRWKGDNEHGNTCGPGRLQPGTARDNRLDPRFWRHRLGFDVHMPCAFHDPAWPDAVLR